MLLEIGEGLEESTLLCRYVSFESLVSLVETQLLVFAAVANWEDPWENELANYYIKGDSGQEAPTYSAEQHHFGQCWTQKIESDAMWRIYSPNLSGVKLFTTIHCLRFAKNTRRLGVERVVYFSDWRELPELTKNDNSRFLTARYKRIAFSHEEEVRFFVHPQDITGGDFHGESPISLPIDISRLIKQVEIDPRAPAWIEDVIKRYMARRLPGTEVSKSRLYDKNKEFKIVREYVPID